MSYGLCYVKLGGGEGERTGLSWGLSAPWAVEYDLLPGGNVNAADWRNRRRPRRLLARPFRHCSVPPAGHCSHKVGLFLRRCPRISTRASD